MTDVMLIYLFPETLPKGVKTLKLPCEVAVKSVVPAIRALLARELTENYGMKQGDAADLLGITQTAVSKYIHRVRGSVLSIGGEKEVKTLIMKTAASLADGNFERPFLALQICTTCSIVRKKRLMCRLCKRTDPALDIEQCKLCFLSACDHRFRQQVPLKEKR
ncbi:MAG: hypothetical protein JSW72_09730 [Candidatus Bathyarchaeota archaeon]|nr:MAG: hypothetical protein JSW72_09730 [Candidatus Bathyarchaeota archaeon]